MTEEFKDKLRRYADGTLTDEEQKEMEQDLEKLEAYQSYIDENMRGEKVDEEATNSIKSSTIMCKKERRLIQRGKWRARINTAITVISFLVLFTLVSGVLTSMFYRWGDRSSVYRDVVSSTVEITQPNMDANIGGSSISIFYGMTFTGDLIKQIGSSKLKVGNFTQEFKLGLAATPVMNTFSEEKVNRSAMFLYPGTQQDKPNSDWSILEKLPEGTVTEAYLSFDQFYSTDEIVEKFGYSGDVAPVWFAVNTGQNEDDLGFNSPIGFPYSKRWNAHLIQEQAVTYNKILNAASTEPVIHPYGSSKSLEHNFVTTLKLLQKYERITKQVEPVALHNLDGILTFIEQNGVSIYGAVVTGPTKEILKLREQTWITSMRVGETRLWNMSE